MRNSFITKLRWFVWPALALVIGLGISRISFNVDPLRLLPTDLAEVQGLGLFLEHFTRPDETIVTIAGEDDEAVEEANRILVERFRTTPGLADQIVDRAPWDDPEGLSEFLAYALLNKPPEQFAELAERFRPENSSSFLQSRLEEMAFALSPQDAVLIGYDPFGLIAPAFGADGGDGLMAADASEFQSEDGTLRLIYLTAPGEQGRGDYRGMVERVGAIREVIEATDLPEGIVVRLTGEPPVVSEISSGMERDIKVSGLTTITVIALIFWFWYRRFRPLCWLVAMLCLIFLITLGIAGLLIRDLTVMNVGFASILIGLSVDYGILIYQSTLRNPGNSAAVRRESQRGICWAAATTSVAFGSLMASSLPGVSELGVLVGLGIAAGAMVMLFVYCNRLASLSGNWPKTAEDEPVSHPERLFFGPKSTRVLGILTLVFVIGCGVLLLTKGMPEVDFSDRATRPRVSEAYEALDEIKAKLMNGENNGYVVVTGTGEQVRNRLVELGSKLEEASEQGLIIRHTLPTNFVPIANFQRENLNQAVRLILSQEERLKKELDEAGFADDAVLAFNAILRQWEEWLETDTLIFPKSDVSDRMLHRFVKVVSPDEVMAAGMVVATLDADLRWLQSEDTQLADWAQTMLALRVHIPGEIMRILAILGVIVVVMLGFTFGRLGEIIWVAITISLSLVAMLGSMVLLGLSWNFFNLAAVLLTLGAGLDYSIHMLLGFRRHGQVLRVQRDVGQALLVCGLSTVAGFGSLAWASNLGLASLGRVCALSLFLNALVAIFLLPMLWNWVHGRK